MKKDNDYKHKARHSIPHPRAPSHERIIIRLRNPYHSWRKPYHKGPQHLENGTSLIGAPIFNLTRALQPTTNCQDFLEGIHGCMPTLQQDREVKLCCKRDDHM